MFTPSIFDYTPPVKNLPPEPMPKRVPKAVKKGGKIVWESRERKCTL